MVRRSLRSRSFRKISVKTPGGRVVTHYKKKTPSVGHCAITGEKLKGVKPGFDKDKQKMSKSQKRPNRPYGGVLSSRGLRLVMKDKAAESFEKFEE